MESYIVTPAIKQARKACKIAWITYGDSDQWREAVAGLDTAISASIAAEERLV